MILLIDIGNTLTKIALGTIEKDKISFLKAIKTKENNYQSEMLKVLKKIKAKIEGAIISCVVPQKLSWTKKIIATTFNCQPIIINHNLIKSLPISISITHQKQIGSDLIVLAVASHHQFGNSITISLGTATTYITIKDDDLKGVIIAPGFVSAKNSLSNDAALIKPFKLKHYQSVLGLTTNHALSVGYGNGFNYMLEATIKTISKELKTNLKTIITGGSFQELKPFLDFKYHYQEDLLMLGLVIIYQMLQKNNKL